MLIPDMTPILRSDMIFVGLPADLCKNVPFSAFLPFLGLKMDLGLSKRWLYGRLVFPYTRVNDLRHGKVCWDTHMRPRLPN